MEKFDAVEAWISNVAVSHSDSIGTMCSYKRSLELFCNFIGKAPRQILEEYENSEDREFKRRYAQYVRAFVSSLHSKGLSPNTIAARVAAVRSFCRYNDLPLGHIPMVQTRVLFHNRDITHEEIRLVLAASKPRERAFFAVMAQSGLRPSTICSLKYKNIKEDFVKERIPCKIDIPQEIAKGKYHAYFTFIGEEAAKHLYSYLSIRPNISEDDYIFLKEGEYGKANPKSMSRTFAQTLQNLKKKGLVKVKQEQKYKPRDVRLYNLRKWFRKHSHQAGFELVQFWMGHTVKAGLEEHYRPTDVEFHRKLYAEKAMPFLRLEKATPTETEKTIEELKEQLTAKDSEISKMKDAIDRMQPLMEKIAKIQPLVEFVNSFNTPEQLKEILDFLKDNWETEPFDEKLRPISTELSPYIERKLDRIAEKKGITRTEALEQLVAEDLELLEEGEERRLVHAERKGYPITAEDYLRKRKNKPKSATTH